jgi:hypothetical protein
MESAGKKPINKTNKKWICIYNDEIEDEKESTLVSN